MLFQGKDGELRLIEHGTGGTTYHLEVLFWEMDFTGPTSRGRTEETLMMDRGNFDSNAHYIEGNDEPRYAPLPISFSCRINDTRDSQVLLDWISGVTILGGTTQIYSFKGRTTIDGNTLPDFVEGRSGTSKKFAYRVEIKWDGTTDVGYRYDEVYFTPGEQSISESADGLTLSASGQVYGDVSPALIAFTTGTVTAN